MSLSVENPGAADLAGPPPALRRCSVDRLRLHRFRNYAEATVHFGPGLNVIHGRNAQGKTNLLEAIATVALTRSPRASSSAELLQWPGDRALAEADVTRPPRSLVLGARFERDSPSGRVSRTTMVDGKARPPRSALGLCPVVLFWPEDLALVQGSPEGRRRFLDVILAQTDPQAADHLSRYRRVLEQRNALLHHLRAGGRGQEALRGFTHELVEHGARVALARAGLVAALAPHAAASLLELSGRREGLELRYAPAHAVSLPCDAPAAERSLLDALEARAAEELARGLTLVGPHRDDLDFQLDGRPARSSASQGQQRSVVLACKLAEMRYHEIEAGMAPVVLLDDVLSELDPQRRGQLLWLLARGERHQVMVTTTEVVADTAGFDHVLRLEVNAGAVRAETAG